MTINTMNSTTWINTHQDFMTFLSQFLVDYQTHAHDWENNNLESFLQAMLSWVEDADGFYQNINQPQLLQNPTWQTFADILMASKVYE